MAVGGGSSGSGGKGIRAGRAYVEAKLDDTGLRAGLEKARRMVMRFGASLAAGGGVLIGIGTAIVGPIIASFREVVDHFDKLNKAADRTGATTEALSKLAYAAEQSDASLEDVTTGLKFMQLNLAAAKQGSQEAQETLAKLGLTVADLDGKDAAEQFAIIADAAERIGDIDLRKSALRGLLGKGFEQLMPMLKGGSGALRDLYAEAERTGSVVSGEDAEAATRAGDAMARAWRAVKNTLLAVGAALLPQADRIEQFSLAVVDAARMVKDWIDENRELVLIVLGVGAAIAAAGAAFVGIGTALFVAGIAISGFAGAIGAAGTVLAAVFSPVGLGIAAIAVATTMLVALAAETETFWEVVDDVSDLASTIWGGLADTFRRTWSGISDALAAGDLKLALKVGLAGLDVIWKGFLLGVQVAWNTFKELFVDGWHDAVTQIELVWNDLGAAITDAMLAVLQFVAEQFGEFFTKVLGKAADLADRVGAGGLAGDLRTIGEAGPGVFAEARKDVEHDRQAKEDAIKEEAKKAQADRDAARAAGMLAAALDLAAAKTNLQALEDEARVAANTAIFAKFMDDLSKPINLPRQAAAIAGMYGVTKGQFGGSGLGAGYGVGDVSIPKKQLDEQRRTNEKLDAIRQELGGIPVE